MPTLLVLGGSGLVGRAVINLAQAHTDIDQLIVPTRVPLSPNPGVFNPLIEYEQLSAAAPWWKADAVICCLGTTRSAAGSSSRFYRIDHDYVLEAAICARNAGCETFVYNSSLGADELSRSLYLRTKGAVERDLKQLGFSSLTLLRPALLDNRGRVESRPGESVAVAVSRLLGGCLPARYRLVDVATLARQLVQAALEPAPGCRVMESESLVLR